MTAWVNYSATALSWLDLEHTSNLILMVIIIYLYLNIFVYYSFSSKLHQVIWHHARDARQRMLSIMLQVETLCSFHNENKCWNEQKAVQNN